MTVRPRPLWLPAAILATLVPVFCWLGVWQVHRAQEKQALQQEYDRRSSDAPRRLDAKIDSVEALRYRHVSARGVYEPEYQILIDNRVHQGVPGYHVVTPLKLEGSDTRVLVNRGWVPLGESREHLPSVDAPPGVQEITGVAVIPSGKIFTLGSESPPGRGWQPVWENLDMKRYAASVPFTVQPIVVLLDANAANGYTREWARLDAGIAMHQGYAFQWFALAVLAFVLMTVLWWRAWSRRQGKKK